MGDSNIDFENTANLLEEDPPPILSSEIREIFYQFTNMLDIKSFMRLAMTSKQMHERCMNDNLIRLNVKEMDVHVEVVNETPTFSFYSSIVFNRRKKYLEKLRQMKCNVSLRIILFHGDEVGANTIVETRRYLAALGVKTIGTLKIRGDFIGWQQASFIKDFHIKEVEIGRGLPDDVLRSLLQSNLDSFTYDGAFQGEVLLQVDSPIPVITLTAMHLSADVFTQILWRIQTGDLKKLVLSFDSVPWDDFKEVPIDYEEPLPEERPLLIASKNYHCCWFLHSNGGLTKCQSGKAFEFFKCEEDDIPAILIPKESVHKALTERCKVRCMSCHFTSFLSGFPSIGAFRAGPIPEKRPLLFEGFDYDDNRIFYGDGSDEDDEKEERFYLLNEDGSLVQYTWEENTETAYCCEFDLETDWPEFLTDHTPLQKYVLDKRIEKRVNEGRFECRTVEEFRYLFKNYKPLPHDFQGQLPERRPLVFEKNGHQEQRFVLYEDGTLIQYNCTSSSERYANVHINPCPVYVRPTILITSASIKETILEAPFKELIYNIDRTMFRVAFKEMKTLPFQAYGRLPNEYPLVFTETQRYNGDIIDHRWVLFESMKVRKCEWEDGQATFSKGDPEDYPPILTKALIKNFFKGVKIDTECDLVVDRDVLNDYLEEFDIVPDDDPRPLSSIPIIYHKKEIKNADLNGDCGSFNEVLHLWLVAEDATVTHVTWGEKEDRHLTFYKGPELKLLPPVLRTKETLDYLLQETLLGEVAAYWYGLEEDGDSYFEGHETLDFSHKGPLPDIRPLVFKHRHYTIHYVTDWWFLRKDNVLIKCTRMGSCYALSVTMKNLPVALREKP